MKDMLKNKRIDDAELEKVSGGVSFDTSKMDSFDTDRYKEFSEVWTNDFSRFSSNSYNQEIFDYYWKKWKRAGFKPDAWTFLDDKFLKIFHELH